MSRGPRRRHSEGSRSEAPCMDWGCICSRLGFCLKGRVDLSKTYSSSTSVIAFPTCLSIRRGELGTTASPQLL